MTTGGTILDEIIVHKRAELEAAQKAVPEARLRELVAERAIYSDFEEAVGKTNALGVNLIAEIKKASPSKGVFRADFDPATIAREYEAGGADAISVLTDERFFQGSLAHLRQVYESGVTLPLLRKDFTTSAYHVLEAAAHGADAVLLIAAVLDREEIEAFAALADELHLNAVLEVYNETELAAAVESPCRIIQINNRDLKTFEVDLGVTRRLAPQVPDGRIIISASGFDSAKAVQAAREAGAHAVLVGESLMRGGDPQATLRALRGAP
ncbi:MAG: indole-3-glycerol phosphate synthase TrpC [Verrucomicrobia bacterium]|nr:indole-3-glycerol phosphate synthase TrpC [Verrucomicrobiota bacterium]